MGHATQTDIRWKFSSTLRAGFFLPKLKRIQKMIFRKNDYEATGSFQIWLNPNARDLFINTKAT